jgi:hypothetical protein
VFRLFLTTIIFLTSTFNLVAQDEIEQIVNRNPFDPDRGQKEEVVEEVIEAEPVEVVTEEHGMILDGTIMFSKSQMAIITIDKPNVNASGGAAATSGARRLGARRNNNRRSPLRNNAARNNRPESKAEALKDQGPQTHTVYVGDELEGYELMSVSSSTAILKKGNETIELQLFSGEKENRGGSKELNIVAKPPADSNAPARPSAQRVPGGDPNPKAGEEKNDSPMKVPDRKFEKRERPQIKRQGSNSNFKM